MSNSRLADYGKQTLKELSKSLTEEFGKGFSNWSVRELKRQIENALFERLLLCCRDANKEWVLLLVLKNDEIAHLADIIRNPYVFGFLALPEDKTVMENGLERALVQQTEKYLLELGRGFMFVGMKQSGEE